MAKEVFTQNARTAFKHALSILGLTKDDVILLPAYIGITDREGSGVLDPIEESGVGHRFYKVDATLSPAIGDLEAQIQAPDVKAVLVIHYFGFPPSTFNQVQELCIAHGKLLIEDCAHALYSLHDGKPVGTFGDAAFFSLHKCLPVPSGGLLRMHVDIPLADDIDPEVRSVYENADGNAIRAARRENYEYLAARLTKVEPLFASLPEGVAPMNFPVRVTGMPRDEFFFALRERGFENSSLYYRLVPGITPEEFPISHELSRTISNLPVHERLSTGDLDRLLAAIEEVHP